MSKTIKSIEKYRFNTFTDGNYDETIEITGEIMSHAEYDTQENLTISITYDTHGNVAEHIVYAYNEQNKMIEELLFDEDEVVEKRQFEYNNEGLIAKEKIFYMDDSFDTMLYTYDADNMLIEKKLINTDNEIESIHKFQFQNKKIINEGDYDAENNLIYEKSYTYDEKGNLIKLSSYDAIEDETLEIFYEYDEKGNRIKILNHDKTGKLATRSTYKYNDANQIIALVEDTTLLSTTYLLEYDETGKVKTQKEIGENEEAIATTSYSYDGDMLIETTSEGEGYSHNYIIKSEIEYYNN